MLCEARASRVPEAATAAPSGAAMRSSSRMATWKAVRTCSALSTAAMSTSAVSIAVISTAITPRTTHHVPVPWSVVAYSVGARGR